MNAKIKSYEEKKKERDEIMKQKEEAIISILNSAKNNPKFVKLLNYSLISLAKSITPPNPDYRNNSKLVIRNNGLDILRSIAAANINREDVLSPITTNFWNILSVNDNVDQELALEFVEKGGHEATIELLLTKPKGGSSIPLIKTLNGLVKVPPLVEKLIDAGLAEAIKIVNDLYSDEINVISMNFDTLRRVTNLKSGREMIIKKNLTPCILENIQKCCGAGNIVAILNGLILLDNLCKSEEGVKAILDSNAPDILSEIVDTFPSSRKIPLQSGKIFSKIISKELLIYKLKLLRKSKDKFEADDNIDNLIEIKKPLSLISNVILVDELAKIVCMPEHFDTLVELFNKACTIELLNREPEYIKTYIQLMSHFMTLFKRCFDHMPDCLNPMTEKGKKCTSLIEKIINCIRKNWEAAKSCVEKLESKGDPEDEVEPIKNAFSVFFSKYNDILNQNYDKRKDAQKKDPKWIELLEYLTGDVIPEGNKYFGVNENSNYAASEVLKITDNIIENFSNISGNLSSNRCKCIPYIKTVVGFSENYKTLSNDLDVTYNTLNKKGESTQLLKNDIISEIVKFMEDKAKFRYPNLVSLNILDEFLTPSFVKEYHSKPDTKANSNYGLNYVSAICSVMTKPFYPSSAVLEEVEGTGDELKGLDEESKEPANEELERKITNKGSELLKRIISLPEFLEQVKIFKKNGAKFNPDSSPVEDVLDLENNLIFQNCALNVDEFFNAGMNEDLLTLKDLIKKEINFIEGFKRIKSNENNPKYQEICSSSEKRLNFFLGTVRKIEERAILSFINNKDKKYLGLLIDISDLNVDIINKSTDTFNLGQHLMQLRKNIPFIRNNEEILSKDKNKPITETYVNSLLNVLRNSTSNEDLCDNIIKTFIAFASKKPAICNQLVKAGCPRLLCQVMDGSQNKELVNNAMELLKMLTLSNKYNLGLISKQNILPKLFEIRGQFASCDEITGNVDIIANEIMKLPGQGKAAKDIILDSIKEFHENVQKNFKDNENKQKILSNLEIINAFSSNRYTVEPLLQDQFVKDLKKATDLTINEPQISKAIENLLNNEMGIIRKVRDNLVSKDDQKHVELVDSILSAVVKKSNFAKPLLLTLKNLSDYLEDEDLYKKYLNNKINDSFIYKLIEIRENYLEDQDIIKEINNVLCHLALRNPKFADTIIKNGGLRQIIEDLRAMAYLNDENSKCKKLGGLKMLNYLLNDPKNLDKFLEAGGSDLINRIVNNEVLNSTKSSEIEEDLPESRFKTLSCINTKTPEQLKEEERIGVNSFDHFVLNRSNSVARGKAIMHDLMGDEINKLKGKKKENANDSDDYFIQCLRIINKGLDKGKMQFLDDKIVDNLTKLATVNFPDKFLFSEVSSILCKPVFKANPEAIKNNESLLKLILSNQAHFYSDEDIKTKVRGIEEKIIPLIMKKDKYKKDFGSSLQKGNMPHKEKCKMLTYLTLATECNDFKHVLDANKKQILKFYNDMMQEFKPVIKKILSHKESSNDKLKKKEFNINNLSDNEKYEEGDVLALIKLHNYLLAQNLIKTNESINKEYLQNIENLADSLYSPDNYIFVNNYNNEMGKLLDKLGKYEDGKEPDRDAPVYNVTDNHLLHLNNMFPKVVSFLNDYHQKILSEPNGYPKLNKAIEDNLDELLNSAQIFYKADEDHDVKANNSKEICDTLLNIFEDYQKDGIIDKSDNGDREVEERNDRIIDRLQKLWDLINNAIKGDSFNLILNNKNSEYLVNMIRKLDEAINKMGLNRPNLRKIPLAISEKISNDENVNQKLIDFVSNDLNKFGNLDDDIKWSDIETLSNLSKYPGPSKLMMKNQSLWGLLKKEYQKDNLNNKQRGFLAEIFRNVTKSNYNVESLIDKDPQFMALLINTSVFHPLKSLNDGGKEIAETEIDTLCNILKDTNNYKALDDNNLITLEDISKMETLYKDKDQKIISPLLPILKQIKESGKAKAESNAIAEDEELLTKIGKRVDTCFEKHRQELMKQNKGKGQGEDGENQGEDNSDVLQSGSQILRKKMSFVSGTLLFNTGNANIKSSLSAQVNPQMTNDLEKLLSILRKNFNDMNKSEDINLNIKRADNIQKCLSTLKKLSLAPDNHKPILEGGLMNFMEKVDENYKLFSDNNTPNLNDKCLGFTVTAKNLLGACSNSINALPSIKESNVLDSTIAEVLQLYNNPDLISNNSDVQKIFLYDNIIMSNLAKDKKAFDEVLNKIGLDKLLNLGQKTGNANLLEGTLGMLENYIQNIPNKNDLPADFVDKCCNIIEKCIKLSGRTPGLMSKALNLAGLLHNSKYAPKLDKLNFVDSMTKDIDKFKNNHGYLNSSLDTLSTFTRNNPSLGQMAVDTGLVAKLREEVEKIIKDGPEKYENEKDPGESQEAYLKLIYNFTKLCNNLGSNIKNSDKFYKTGIIGNNIDILKKFNNQVQPMTKKEKEKAKKKGRGEDLVYNAYGYGNLNYENPPKSNLRTKGNTGEIIEKNDPKRSGKSGNGGNILGNSSAYSSLNYENPPLNLTRAPRSTGEIDPEKGPKNSRNYLDCDEIDGNDRNELIRGIVTNSVNTLDQITGNPEAIKYLSEDPDFPDTILEGLKNSNNSKEFLATALHSLGNYLNSSACSNYNKLNPPKLYEQLRDLQSKYYSDPEILRNINYICGSLIKNNKDKEYAKKFYDLISESSKCQDWNSDLIIQALKQMQDGLIKNPELINQSFDGSASNLLNLLNLYKDNPEIQSLCYKTLDLFAKNNVFSSSLINNGLLTPVKGTLENPNFQSKVPGSGKETLKNSSGQNGLEGSNNPRGPALKLMGRCADEESNRPKIADKLMLPLIKELSDKNKNNPDKQDVIILMDKLMKDQGCIQPFVQFNGIDEGLKLLKENESNPEIALQLFRLFKNIALNSDNYKDILKEKGIENLTNDTIKQSGPKDKRIEPEGKSLIFTVNMGKIKLENVNDVDLLDIKIDEPIPPEVKNFLTNGKQVKVINENGDIKEMQLIFSPDLLKISAKKLKSKLPPKPKYIIDTPTIKKLIKGHGTDAFKKSKGFFRKVPDPSLCFSIVGPTSIDGLKALNIQCENEESTNKWVNYIEIVINHFRKTHTIKGTVVVKK